MIEMRVSDDHMAVACLVLWNVSVKRQSMLNCCGNALYEKALCKSPVRSDLDPRHTASGKEGIFMLVNHNVSTTPLLHFLR